MRSDDVVEQATAQLGHMEQLLTEAEARNARLEEELGDARARLAEQAKACWPGRKSRRTCPPSPSLTPRRARRACECARPSAAPASLASSVVGPAELPRSLLQGQRALESARSMQAAARLAVLVGGAGIATLGAVREGSSPLWHASKEHYVARPCVACVGRGEKVVGRPVVVVGTVCGRIPLAHLQGCCVR